VRPSSDHKGIWKTGIGIISSYSVEGCSQKRSALYPRAKRLLLVQAIGDGRKISGVYLVQF
jgi:hypothetical protein